jgi:hypothetical protein
MDAACGTYGEEEKCRKSFCGETIAFQEWLCSMELVTCF